ncbi:MAG: membrane protein insertase YidC [Desulfosalsimonas sp.]
MEHVRLLLAIVLTIMVFVLWELLFVPEKPDMPREVSEQTETEKSSQSSDSRDRQQEQSGQSDGSRPVNGSSDDSLEVPAKKFNTISVEHDLYKAEFSEKGAAVKRFVLKDYRVGPGEDADPRVLVPEENEAGTVLVRFADAGLPDTSEALFTTDSDTDSLRIGEKAETLSFYFQNEDGLVMEKRYRFYPDSYKIGLTVNLVNNSARAVPSELFLDMTNPPPTGRTFVFQGPFAYIDGDLEEVDVDDIDDKSSYPGSVKWTAIGDRYFMTALVPREAVQTKIRLSNDDQEGLVRVSYLQPGESIAPGGTREFEYELFMGPKRMSELKSFGRDLDEAINFGFFDIIAKPCLWLMNKIHDNVVSNYGVAIILLTIVFKIVFWPLGSKSYRSMAEMKKLQPLMTEIRNKYKDDKKKMNEEVMRLYRTYKVNPMSGCLPMIVQIPVFIAFYRMLYGAIELRHAPFMFWINDLSSPDRLFSFDVTIPFMAPPYGIPVLTIIMGATMFLQQKLSPPPGDPSQARIMMFMPLIFTVIFINFPAGLVLYWLTNNVFSIAQQYYVTRKIV